MNKRGEGDAVADWLGIGIFLFFIVIITVGVMAGAYLFFGNGVDGRQVDADLLNYKIKNCILDNGIEVLGDEFYEVCGLEERFLDRDNLIFKVCVGESGEECLVSDGVISKGSDFNTCGFKGAEENEGFKKCSIESVEFEDSTYLIVTGSNQVSRRGNE